MDEDQEFGEEYESVGSEETTATNDDTSLYEDLYNDQEADATAEGSDTAEETPAPPVAEATEDEYTPPAYTVPLLAVDSGELFSDTEAEQYNELMLTNPAQAQAWLFSRQREILRRDNMRVMQAQVLHGNTLASLETECGEWYRQHGATIRQTMATLPPEQSGTETAKFAALIAPALYEVQAGADAVKTFTRMARMAARGGTQSVVQSANPAPVTPQPPPRVAPSGSRTGAQPGRKPGIVNDMMELFGADEGDVRRALDVAKGRR